MATTKLDGAYVISLARRADRLKMFEDGVTSAIREVIPPVEVVLGVDGHDPANKPPEWWKGGKGAWGCWQSHVRVWEMAKARGQKAILIFEDDALFSADFVKSWAEYWRQVPDDWEMVYPGGQLLGNMSQQTHISKNIVFPLEVNRLHAYCVTDKFIDVMLEHAKDEHHIRHFSRHHIDHWLGQLHQKMRHRIYCFQPWLVGQRCTTSDIGVTPLTHRFWDYVPADKVVDGKDALTVTMVMGGLRCGGSLVGGAFRAMGAHMGAPFVCGKRHPRGSYASTLLDEFLAAHFTMTGRRLTPHEIVLDNARNLINLLKAKAVAEGTPNLVLRHPLLAYGAWEIWDALQGEGRVVVCTRPVEEVRESLRKIMGEEEVRDVSLQHEVLIQKSWEFVEKSQWAYAVTPYNRLWEDGVIEEAARVAKVPGARVPAGREFLHAQRNQIKLEHSHHHGVGRQVLTP